MTADPTDLAALRAEALTSEKLEPIYRAVRDRQTSSGESHRMASRWLLEELGRAGWQATRREEIIRAEVERLREALADFYDGACLVSRQFNIVQPFVELTVKHADVRRWIEARRATDPAWTEDLVKVAARAVYDCEMPDHDALAVLIHNSDFIDGGKPLPEQLADVLAVCTTIARAAISAIVPRIRAEERERAAKVCEARATYPKCPHTDWDDACLACARDIREATP